MINKADIKIALEKDLPISFFDQLFEIDKICYGDIDILDEGGKDDWLSSRKASFCFIATLNDKAIGYIDIVAINNLGLRTLLDGKYRDGEIGKYADLEQKEYLNLYVCSIAILPEYRGIKLSKDLWQSVMEYFRDNKIGINKIYATIWSEDGKRFFDKLGAKTVLKDCGGREVVGV